MDWKSSFDLQMESLTSVANSKEIAQQIKKFIDISKKTRGIHYFTGIGKNGFVAATAATTFNSLGIRSMFVDPVNSLHGDMNIFMPNDLVVCLSKSGETYELLSFVDALKNVSPKTTILSITSKENTSLSKMSSNCITIPIEREADHLNLAPLSGIVTYIAVLQAIAVELSSHRGFSVKDFIRGHPGGTLGKTKTVL